MPTYEYKCGACGHQFEKFHSITAAPIKQCPECGKKKVKRLIGTGAGLIFKGSGFYITDYRSDAYKTAAKSDSGATPASSPAAPSASSSSSASATPSSSESKPASSASPAAPSTPAKSSAKAKQ